MSMSAAELLRDEQQRFRTIFEGAAFGILLMDSQCYVLEANPTLQELLGYTEDELRGETFEHFGHPDERVNDAAAIRHMRTGAPVPVVRRERRYVHKDGHTVWVQVTCSDVRDERNNVRYFIAIAEDVTDRRRTEAALHESEERNRAILGSALDGIISIDADRRITEFNSAAERMFGRPRPEMLGRDVAEVVDLPDEPSTGELHGRRLETCGYRYDGSSFAIEVAVASYTLGDRPELTCHLRDITARNRTRAALEHQATHDALTGLPNRKLLRDRLEEAIQAGAASEYGPALLLLDLDRFKEVNDTLGHYAGDLLLQELAKRLECAVGDVQPGDSATVARLGGDEFALILPTAVDLAAIATALLRALEAPFCIEGHNFAVGASVGVAQYPQHGEDVTALLRHADVAMYAAKRGKTGYVIYSPDRDQHTIERLALLAELRHALSGNELVLHYQPKLELATGRIVGVEALVRWEHPSRGMVGPDQFIPLAEQTGLIAPLTTWVLREAILQVRAWQTRGIAVPVAVNLSPSSLQDQGLADQIRELLDDAGLDPKWLELEITESAYMAHPDAAIASLERLRAMGIRVAIDDFGTGYSSLSYLELLPVDELKIDRSFVSHLGTKKSHSIIVRAVIDLAHDLGLKVVAEGLEDEATCQALLALGCDFAQGYHLGRPAPAPMLAARLAQNSPLALAA